MKLHKYAFVLLIIGGINWLLIGAFGYNLVGSILGGNDSVATRVVYILVGLSAILEIAGHKKLCRNCRP